MGEEGFYVDGCAAEGNIELKFPLHITGNHPRPSDFEKKEDVVPSSSPDFHLD